MEYVIPERMLLLDALRVLFPDSSRRTLQHWLKGGRFTVDQNRLDRDCGWLEQGQVLCSQEQCSYVKKERLPILFQDRSLIVIDKPVGLLSVPLDAPSLQEDALHVLRRRLRTEHIFAVHRLDRETSGVMIFARGLSARARLKDLFEAHRLEREYSAIVEGVLTQDQGTWRCPLRELPNYDVEPSSEGREAITHFEVLHRSQKYSYLRLLLETGRKHQIRVHCARAGAPVLGDARYGSQENPLGRIALHARRIAFTHPFTQRPLSFTSPLPAAFQKLLPPALKQILCAC